jgi:hypothetical protein
MTPAYPELGFLSVWIVSSQEYVLPVAGVVVSLFVKWMRAVLGSPSMQSTPVHWPFQHQLAIHYLSVGHFNKSI